MFIDRVVVQVVAGTGGSGASSFRREKFVPKGGPDGGDGGHGGSVYVKTDTNLATLLDYRYHTKWIAARGAHGKGKNMSGKSAEDVYLPVPPGTEVRDADTGEVFGEMIAAARPKIADYPFTTLEPHLGVVGMSDNRSFVVADIPGIIEGAHEGKGLGLRFLQHVERTRILAVLVPIDSPDPQATYDLLRREAASYSKELASKPHDVVLTKADLTPDTRHLSLRTDAGAPVVTIS